MTKRILPQVTVSFLLGILCSYYEKIWIYVVGIIWLICMGIVSYQSVKQQQKQTCSNGKKLQVFTKIVCCFVICMVGYIRCNVQQNTTKVVEGYLEKEQNLNVVGTIYKKEEKNNYIIYYLKNSYIITKEGYISCNQILIYPNSDEYSIGDTIQVKGKYDSFSVATNEGNFHEKNYYNSKNILFRVKENSSRIIKKSTFSLGEKLYRLRKKIYNVYITQLPEKEAGVLSVMTLGEKGLLDSDMKKLYQRSGISHILAISGLHVSILGMSLYKLLRKWRFPYWCCAIVAAVVVVAFGEISGMEISTGRAVIMFLIMLLGNILGMTYDTLSALSLSAILQLLENPYGLWYAGFLFSYSAVLAVVVVSKILQGRREESTWAKQKGMKGWLKKCGKKFVGTLFVSSSIQLVTLPLTVYFYYELPIYSILINGLLLPFMSVLLMSGILGGIVGVFARWISWILLKPAYFLLNWNEWICEKFETLPGANWIVGKPSLILVVGYYVILVLVLTFLYNQKEISKWKRIGAMTIIGISLLLVLVLRGPVEFQISFLDVGQGDGIFVQAKNGTVFFVDGGSTSENMVGEYRISSFLKCRGITHVDGWFVSHGDGDHVSGLLEIWESGYRIDNLFLAKDIVKDEAWEKLCNYAETYNTNIIYLEPGQKVEAGKMRLTCLFPKNTGTDRNKNSLVLYLEYLGLTGLLTGDISKEEEKLLMQEYPGLQADIYKAAHHGSNGSNGEAYLKQIRPEISIISCAMENSYGHPGEDTIENIKLSGSKIFYTMKSGQITIGYRNGQMWLREYIFAKP